jgi:hypothetical protein
VLATLSKLHDPRVVQKGGQTDNVLSLKTHTKEHISSTSQRGISICRPASSG